MSDAEDELVALRSRVASLERQLASRRGARWALRYAEDLVQTLHEPLIVLDEDLTIRLVNRAFYDAFRRRPRETLGQRLFDIDGGAWAVPRLRSLLEEILEDDTALVDFEVNVSFPGFGTRVLLLNARRIERRDEGETTVLLAIEDITSRHQAQVSLTEAALRDRLTGIYNRRGFKVLAKQALRGLRRSARPAQLLFADVDNLKHINDEHGHAAGDEAIVAVARALQACFRESDIAARYGGDEFLALVVEGDAEIARQRLVREVERFEPSWGRPLSISVGLVRCEPTPDLTIDSLVTRADKAMYVVKRARARERVS